ncbi:MAG: glycosyltransferase family 4 protein [Nitrococcus sp.]|nr:glycosyltransferase family 4 protein [Nitrococcus sp.]
MIKRTEQCQPAVDVPRTIRSKPSFLFCLPWDIQEVGGVNEVVRNLIRQTIRDGRFSPLLLQPSWNAPEMKRDVAAGIERVRLLVPALVGTTSLWRHTLSFLYRLPGCLWHLRAFFRNVQPAAINIHYPGPWVVPLWIAVRLWHSNCSFILSFHGSDLTQINASRWLTRHIWRALLKRTDRIICCSKSLADKLRAFSGNLEQILVIHNAIDAAALDEAYTAAANEPRLFEDRPYLSNLATFEFKKGQDVLIEAFAKVRVRRPTLGLAIAGREGPALEQLRQQIRRFGLEDDVRLMINLPHGHSLKLLHDSQLFVLSSREEPFGIVLLEANYFGVPVIASASGGIPEVITDGITGFLVPREDPDALATAIERLLADRALAMQLATNAKQINLTGRSWREAYQSYVAAAIATPSA